MTPQTWKPASVSAVLLALSVATVSSVVNRTIDDEYGDEITGLRPTYVPPLGWANGAGCRGCGVQLDANKTFRGTWHDATAGPGTLRMITTEFNGTAVYVFCAIVNRGFVVSGVNVRTQLTFAVDGAFVGDYLHEPTDAADALYQVPVYSNRTLQDGQHDIVITLVPDPTTQSGSLILFDYITYTTSNSSSPGSHPTAPIFPSTTSYGLSPLGLGSETAETIQTTVPGAENTNTPSSGPAGTRPPMDSRTPVGPIVGGTAGGVLALVICFLLFRLFHRRASKWPASPQEIQDGDPEVLDLHGILPSIRNASPAGASSVTHANASVSSNRCESMDSFGPQSSPSAASSSAMLPHAQPPETTSRLHHYGRYSYQRISALLEITFRRFIAIERRLGTARALHQYQVEKREIMKRARAEEGAV